MNGRYDNQLKLFFCRIIVPLFAIMRDSGLDVRSMSYIADNEVVVRIAKKFLLD